MNKAIVFTLTLVLAVTTITLTIATAQEYIPTETVSSGLVLDLAIMKEGFQLAAVVGDDLKIWDASTLAHQRTVDTNFEKAYSVAYRKGWYEAAVGGNNGRLEFWNTLAGSRMATVDPPGSDYFICLEYSPDGKRLASGSDENRVHIWYTDHRNGTRRVLRTLVGHTGGVNAVVWCPNGQMLASGSDDGTVRLWNPNNGINFATLQGHRNAVTDVEFSPDGQTLASASRDAIRLWDVDTESLQHVRNLPQDNSPQFFGRYIEFQPNGQSLFYSGSTRLFLYDPSTGEYQDEISITTGAASGPRGYLMVFHPTGKYIFVHKYNNNKGEIRGLTRLTVDVTGNGVVDLNDRVEVSRSYGMTVASGANPRADVNKDGRVDIEDLTAVAEAINPAFAAPPVAQEVPHLPFTAQEVQKWIEDAKAQGIDADGIAMLERLLQVVLQQANPPKETALLANYPNPFNPETWIPYQLATPAEVRVSIHSADGTLVRTLELGQLPAGVYQEKDRAAYWDGTNELGESVASGVYFYTLTAGDFSATRKLLIRK